MSFGTFEANLSDAGLCDYLLQDLDDDPGALYNTVSVLEQRPRLTKRPLAAGAARAGAEAAAGEKTAEGRLRAGAREDPGPDRPKKGPEPHSGAKDETAEEVLLRELPAASHRGRTGKRVTQRISTNDTSLQADAAQVLATCTTACRLSSPKIEDRPPTC